MMRLISMGAMLGMIAVADARAQMPKETARGPAADVKAMYEDIEILRRILIKDLSARPGMYLPTATYGSDESAVRRGIEWLYRNQSDTYEQSNTLTALAALYAAGDQTFADANSNSFWVTKRSGIATIEGAYLKGHGVTYTLAVSPAEHSTTTNAAARGAGLLSICIKCHLPESADRYLNPGVPNRAPPKPSDWEKYRREIKGDKAESEPSVASRYREFGICGPGMLTEKVLSALAENGHNFKQLQGTENITVVFTFGFKKVEASETQRKASIPPTLRSAEENAALGDLHLKQQKYAEASQSYGEAIKQLESGPLAFSAEMNYDKVQQYLEDARKLLTGSYTKLAQALLAAGKTAEARAALAKAETATVKVNLNAKAPPEKVSPNLPGKLLISVSKRALDQHHEGKLSLEQLRKDADVQTINLPPAEKKTP